MAARAALARGRLSEAAAALDEVIELDPRLPELSGLTADFDALRRSGTPRRGPWIAASGAFAATILAASWLQDTAPLASRPMLMAGLALPARAPVVSPARDSASVATTGTIATTDLTVNVRPATTSALGIQIPDAAVAVPPPAPANPIVPPPTPIVIPAVQPPTQTQSQAQTQMRSQTQNQTRPAGDSPAVVPAAASIPSHVDQPDDGALVQQTLQRYRRAYDGLDARSAQAVWPAVNEAALARAFDGLESQTLTFDGCEVHMFTATATATCQGSARYVPKVGNREPRVEPRTWTFALRKDGGDWKIDSARVER